MIDLEPFAVKHLAVIQPWFDNPETSGRLGGRDWPGMVLRLAASPPPGTTRMSFVARAAGEVVGLADLELEDGGDASFAVVVAPERRGRGHAGAIVALLLGRCEVVGRRVSAGVEPDNTASRRLAESAGLVQAGIDGQGLLVYRRRS